MNTRLISSRLIVVLIALGFAGGIAFLTMLGLPSGASSKNSDGPVITAQGRELLHQFSAAFEAAAAQVSPSVVPIFSEQVTKVANPFGGQDDPFRQFFGDDPFRQFFGNQPKELKQTVRALGSGVIISKDGYILTNNHVVKGAEKLTVKLQNKESYPAKVIGTDPQTDLAVIKIDARNLQAARLGNSDTLRVGEWVIAIGNPFELMNTVTAGIISAKGRSNVNLAEYEDFIQTDASINPGNSGGALADLDGNVIGINTAIYSPSGGNVGIGFAIPIDMAKKVMDQLISRGKISRGYLGLLPQDIDENLVKALHLNTSKGALVGDVTDGGPAEKAGIKRGDIITKFDGTEVTNSIQLRNAVAETAPGTAVKVTVVRDGKEHEFTVTLGDRSKALASAETNSNKAEETSKKLGLTVQNLTSETADQLGYKGDHGVVVTDVAPGSTAEDAGIQKKDLIKQVNRADVNSTADFSREIRKLSSGDTVAFLVRRGANTFYVATTIP